MGNVTVIVFLQPQNIKDEWRWIPKVSYKSWYVREEQNCKVKYFEFRWLCFYVGLDNER